MKEYDEAQRQIWDLLGLYYRTDLTLPQITEQILNLKGAGWRVAIVKDQGLIGSFIIDKENPKFYQEVIWQGDKE